MSNSNKMYGPQTTAPKWTKDTTRAATHRLPVPNGPKGGSKGATHQPPLPVPATPPQHSAPQRLYAPFRRRGSIAAPSPARRLPPVPVQLAPKPAPHTSISPTTISPTVQKPPSKRAAPCYTAVHVHPSPAFRFSSTPPLQLVPTFRQRPQPYPPSPQPFHLHHIHQLPY